MTTKQANGNSATARRIKREALNAKYAAGFMAVQSETVESRHIGTCDWGCVGECFTDASDYVTHSPSCRARQIEAWR